MKNLFIRTFILSLMLVLASPSLVHPGGYYVEADIRESGSTDLRGDTVNTTRDREAIICGQIIPENPRSPRGEGVNCSPTPIEPTPTGNIQPTPTGSAPLVTPPIGGPIATPTNKPSENKTEEHKDESKGGGGTTTSNEPPQPVKIKGLSKTASEFGLRDISFLAGLVCLLLYVKSKLADRLP